MKLYLTLILSIFLSFSAFAANEEANLGLLLGQAAAIKLAPKGGATISFKNLAELLARTFNTKSFDAKKVSFTNKCTAGNGGINPNYSVENCKFVIFELTNMGDEDSESSIMIEYSVKSVKENGKTKKLISTPVAVDFAG